MKLIEFWIIDEAHRGISFSGGGLSGYSFFESGCRGYSFSGGGVNGKSKISLIQ